MPSIPLNLSLAERQGLTLYSRRLEQFSGVQRTEAGVITEVRRSLPDDRVVGTLGGKNPIIVHLERIAADNWEGECTCDAASNCVHCAAVADAALGIVPGATAAPAPAQPTGKSKGRAKTQPQPVPYTPPLTQRAADLLGRGLITSEVAYLQRLEGSYIRARATRNVTVQDVVGLAESSGASTSPTTSGYFSVNAWPSFPNDAIEYWHAIARQARLRNLPLPAFMERIGQLAPPPQAWLKVWEQQDINDWLHRLEDSDRTLESSAGPDAAAGSVADTLDVRVILTQKAPRVEIWTSSQPTWRAAKKSVLVSLATDYFLGKLEIVPECVQLWEPIARSAGSPYDFEVSYHHGFPFQRLLAQALQKPNLHSRFFNEDLQPLEFSEAPFTWKVSSPTPEQPQYRVELVLANGSGLGDVLIRLKGPPAFAITRTSVYRLPPIPTALSPDRPTLIPARAVETEAGLRLLNRIGATLPEDLAALAERIPLHLYLEFSVMGPESAYKPAERVIVFASTRTPTQQTIDSFQSGMWVQPRSRNESKSQRIAFYDRDKVPPPVDVLEPIGARWDDGAGAFSLRITRNFPENFAIWARNLDPSIQLALPPLLRTILEDPVVATVSLNATQTDVDWFDLSVEITSQNTDLTPDELSLLLNAQGGYVRLGDKGWRRAQINLSPEDTEQLAHIGLNPLDLSSEPQRFHALQLADEATRKLLPEAQAEAIERRASELKARVTPPVPSEIQASLRPYQVDGFHFLAYLAENRFGGVLADDMGLGKTLQTLTWIAWLRSAAAANPAPEQPSRILIVCPKSVAPNWRAEANRFLPNLRVSVWQGQSAADFTAVLGEADALVLNFAQLRGLQDQLAAQHWLAVIVDEAQAIKNPDSQTAQSARSLKARHRLALTGTPIENRLMDLWSILAFAMPGALGSRAEFQRSFGKASDSLARRRLSARVRPFLLRRTKSQVAQDLPPRIEEDLICELDGVQRDLYRAEYKKARTLLLKVKSSADLDQLRFHFLTSLLRLRQICCHPALVDKRQLKQPSAKVEALIDVLEPLMEEGHKVLIFSQFVSMLDLLQEQLRSRSWKDFYLAGDTEDRGPLVDSFNQHEGAAIFLISLKAGGFGLNLTSASYVVLFDPWWNPAVESQAIDRTHRIGQKNTVIAYRLLVKGSIEEKIRELQKQKSALAGDILGEERFSQALTIDDLQFLFSSAEPSL